LVDLKIDGELTPEMKAAMLNGVTVRFIFSIRLYEVIDFWFDRKTSGVTVVHELRYDVMRKAYKIVRSRGDPLLAYTKDLDHALRMVSEIDDLEIMALRSLQKGGHYQLMVGTVLSIKSYPLLSIFREFKSDRYTVNFIH